MKFNSIYSNSMTIASLLVALGIIYRDIGTKSWNENSCVPYTNQESI